MVHLRFHSQCRVSLRRFGTEVDVRRDYGHVVEEPVVTSLSVPLGVTPEESGTVGDSEVGVRLPPDETRDTSLSLRDR